MILYKSVYVVIDICVQAVCQTSEVYCDVRPIEIGTRSFLPFYISGLKRIISFQHFSILSCLIKIHFILVNLYISEVVKFLSSHKERLFS